MITENLSTLKIHKLTQAQYDRELAAGRIDENALYLTPDEEIDLSGYATKEELNTKADTLMSLIETKETELLTAIDEGKIKPVNELPESGTEGQIVLLLNS